MNKEIRIYQTDNGRTPFLEWLDFLKDRLAVAKIKTRLDRLSLGHYGDVKHIGNGVFELRISFGPGYRLYFAEQDAVIILIGGDKGTQVRDIKKAQNYWKNFKERCYEKEEA